MKKIFILFNLIFKIIDKKFKIFLFLMFYLIYLQMWFKFLINISNTLFNYFN